MTRIPSAALRPRPLLLLLLLTAYAASYASAVLATLPSDLPADPPAPVREVFLRSSPSASPGRSGRSRRSPSASSSYPFAPSPVGPVGHPRSPAPAGINLRIVGGRNATCGQFPHQASMQVVMPSWSSGEEARHLCGGSLVAARWVLTAAHCLYGVPATAKRVEVLLGDIYLSRESCAPGTGCDSCMTRRQRIIVERMLAHGAYEPDNNYGVGPNDIALLKLVSDADLSSSVSVRPAALPVKDVRPSGTATLSGWGSISTDGNNPHYPNQLRTADFPLLDWSKCNRIIEQISGSGEENPFGDDNLCAMDTNNTRLSSCSGDSGGPLVQQKFGTTTVIGVVSWGYRDCGKVLFPSVFTRVSAFVDWINSVQEKC